MRQTREIPGALRNFYRPALPDMPIWGRGYPLPPRPPVERALILWGISGVPREKKETFCADRHRPIRATRNYSDRTLSSTVVLGVATATEP